MRTGWMLGASVLVVAGALTVVGAEPAVKLPPGPIQDRHDLMEGIGKNAKIIGDAVKAGKFDPVGDAAEKIHASAAKISSLFPPGSTHPNSRAKPEIWSDWAKFESLAKDLGTNAGALAATAKSGGDIPAAAQKLFGTCKTCHEQFRVPEKKKGES